MQRPFDVRPFLGFIMFELTTPWDLCKFRKRLENWRSIFVEFESRMTGTEVRM
jgi:hypothetical protein